MFDEHYNYMKIINLRYGSIYLITTVVFTLLFLLTKFLFLLLLAMMMVMYLTNFIITAKRYLKYIMTLDGKEISKISGLNKKIIFHKINNIPVFSNEIICLKNTEIEVNIRANGKLYKNVKLHVKKEFNNMELKDKKLLFNNITIDYKKR